MKRLWILTLILCGCASMPIGQDKDKTFQATRIAFIEAAGGYHDALAKDNAAVKACYSRNQDLSKALRKELCPPKISQAARDNATKAIHVADSAILIIDAQLSLGSEPDPKQMEKIEAAITSLNAIGAN